MIPNIDQDYFQRLYDMLILTELASVDDIIDIDPILDNLNGDMPTK